MDVETLREFGIVLIEWAKYIMIWASISAAVLAGIGYLIISSVDAATLKTIKKFFWE